MLKLFFGNGAMCGIVLSEGIGYSALQHEMIFDIFWFASHYGQFWAFSSHNSKWKFSNVASRILIPFLEYCELMYMQFRI